MCQYFDFSFLSLREHSWLTRSSSESNSKDVWNAEVNIPGEKMMGRFADDLDGYYFSLHEGIPPLKYPMQPM